MLLALHAVTVAAVIRVVLGRKDRDIGHIMFGTLHWNPRTEEVEFVERPQGSSDPEKNSACDRCRAKKVRGSVNRSWITSDVSTLDPTLTRLGFFCRSNAVPNMVAAHDACDFERRAPSAPSSAEAIEWYGRRASTPNGRSARRVF